MESHKDVIYRKKRQKKSVFMKLKQKREKKNKTQKKTAQEKKNVAHTSFDSVVETNVEICDLLAYRVRSHTKY